MDAPSVLTLVTDSSFWLVAGWYLVSKQVTSELQKDLQSSPYRPSTYCPKDFNRDETCRCHSNPACLRHTFGQVHCSHSTRLRHGNLGTFVTLQDIPRPGHQFLGYLGGDSCTNWSKWYEMVSHQQSYARSHINFNHLQSGQIIQVWFNGLLRGITSAKTEKMAMGDGSFCDLSQYMMTTPWATP